MFKTSRPDVTTEGWHGWPTETVSHALVREPRLRATIDSRATALIKTSSEDLVPFILAGDIRDQVERLVSSGEAEELRESLVAYALSRVDWLQLAAAATEAAIPEKPEIVGVGAI